MELLLHVWEFPDLDLGPAIFAEVLLFLPQFLQRYSGVVP
jgi:hypothetical protein